MILASDNIKLFPFISINVPPFIKYPVISIPSRRRLLSDSKTVILSSATTPRTFLSPSLVISESFIGFVLFVALIYPIFLSPKDDLSRVFPVIATAVSVF